MSLLLVVLFGWLLQFSESQNKETFELTVTVGNFSPTVVSQCEAKFDNCQYLKGALCKVALAMSPNQMIPQSPDNCTATSLTSITNGVMKWRIELKIITSFSDELMVNLSCPTYGELFSYSLPTWVKTIDDRPFYLLVDSYMPQAIPFDHQNSTSVGYSVSAQLVFKNQTFEDSNDSVVLLNRIKSHLMIRSVMGSYLFSSPDVLLSDLSRIDNESGVFITFIVNITVKYQLETKINPYCDVAALLQLSLTDVWDTSAYKLLNVTVTPSASVMQKPFKALVLALALSYMLVKI